MTFLRELELEVTYESAYSDIKYTFDLLCLETKESVRTSICVKIEKIKKWIRDVFQKLKEAFHTLIHCKQVKVEDMLKDNKIQELEKSNKELKETVEFNVKCLNKFEKELNILNNQAVVHRETIEKMGYEKTEMKRDYMTISEAWSKFQKDSGELLSSIDKKEKDLIHLFEILDAKKDTTSEEIEDARTTISSNISLYKEYQKCVSYNLNVYLTTIMSHLGKYAVTV